MSDPGFPGNDGYPGFRSIFGSLTAFNAISFVIQQILAGVATSMIVQVKTVTPGAGLLPGNVDVQPMVNQVGGNGNPVPHGTIYNVPFLRLQGGTSAVIIDPAVGDIGLAVFASRDISSVKVNKAVSNPGSRRRFNMADGLYFGGFLNGVPAQYVQFLADGAGINIVTPGSLTFQSEKATLDADGNLSVSGNVTWDKDGAATDARGHTHGGVQTGGSNTSPPNPGS